MEQTVAELMHEGAIKRHLKKALKRQKRKEEAVYFEPPLQRWSYQVQIMSIA